MTKLLKRIKRWIEIEQARDALADAGMCPDHRVLLEYSRWIGTYCPVCSMEKFRKKCIREADEKAASDSRVQKAIEVLNREPKSLSE